MATITAEDIAALALNTLDAQKTYFQTRFKPDLTKAMKLETALRTLCKQTLGDEGRERTARADTEDEDQQKLARDAKAGIGLSHERCINCNRFVALGVMKCPSCGQVPYEVQPPLIAAP